MAKRQTTAKNMGTGRVPLRFAAEVSARANAAFADGRGPMMEAVTPVTRALLAHWFTEPWTTDRALNFHAGQRQAILNVIYLHEVLKAGNMREAYAQIDESLLAKNGGAAMRELGKAKYGYPKYCVKMATGTGKTWVLNALLVWQYLNAKFEKGEKSGLWTKNFVVVAPGLIVYERLLDAFCGKRVAACEGAAGEARDFATSDLKACEALFVPPAYRDAVFSFVQNGVVRKEDFGRKVTGDGVLAVMNWHAFLGDDDVADDAGGDEGADGGAASDPDGKGILDDLLPAKPGVAAGNALETLDAQHLRGGRLDFLKDLPDLMLVNDEAHHVHGVGRADEEDAVKWQRGIDLLAAGGKRFMQLDFSATPYEATGAGRNAREDFFPHVAVDYDLKTAIREGRVKTIVIDRRKEIDSLVDLDYRAVRDGKNVVGLSEGQRVMLRAGLTKLRYLEGEFARFGGKPPKMMVVCEETAVAPFVREFLLKEGLGEEDVLTIDSNRQGEVGEKEWAKIKGTLFAIDKAARPKVVVSVLMLREGFDVNNICVIVPLRATQAQILLEQTLGRGLRLMWREPEFQEVKELSRRQLLVEHVEPAAVLDMLYVVEHPAFASFYDRLVEEGLVGTGAGEGATGAGGGDLVESVLKEGFERHDLFWPIILRESEEVLSGSTIDEGRLEPFRVYTLAQLRQVFAKDGEVFVGQELLVKTTFGEYRVHANLFNAASYNEYLQGIIGAVFRRFTRVAGRQTRALPALQVNLAQIAEVIDRYIRERLFGEPFDPFAGSDWKILLCYNGIVTDHVVQQVGRLVLEIERGTVATKASVQKRWFSEVARFYVREASSLELEKTIYTRTGYPTNGGGLERDFLEFLDLDAGVERFVKVNEARHLFARLVYLRTDGLLGEYIPDFLVATKESVFLVETKAAGRAADGNVQQKRKAAIEWCKRVNALEAGDRLERRWAYLLVTDSDFYQYKSAGGTFADLSRFAELTESGFKGEFDFG